MTQRALTAGLDFTELVQLVAREVDAGQRASQPTTPGEGKLHVAGVRVRLGQLEPPPESTDDDEPPSFLLLDRYPLARQGWQFEIELSAGPAPPRARGPDGGWVRVPVVRQATLVHLFGKLPVNAIKGAAAKWASKFERIGVGTVAELSSVKREDLQALVTTEHSRLPLELQFKAWMLNVVPPLIPPSAADAIPLSRLTGKTSEELRALVGRTHFSALASEQLATLLSLLFTTIDFRVLGTVALQDLRSVSTPS